MDDSDDYSMDDVGFGQFDKPLSDLRVMVLQRELVRRGLPSEGRKHELVERLQTALDDEDASGMRPDASAFIWDIAVATDQVNVPKARAGHGLVSFCNRLYLFGGFSMAQGYNDRFNEAFPTQDQPNRTPSVDGPHYNSVHEYSIDTKTWKELHPGSTEPQIASIPKARRHASLVVHGCSLFVYGGFDANDDVLSDMWEFDLQRQSWSNVQYRVDPNCNPPIGRAEHTAVVYLNRMIIFGGYDGKRKLNDTYIFDFATKTWGCPTLSEHNAPSRRCKHTAVLYNSSMYVVGGFQFHNGENYALTDMHVLDMHSFVWTNIVMNPGCPQALQGHKAIVVKNNMYVLGGKVRVSSGNGGEQRSTGLNSNVFCYGFETFRWSVVKVAGYPPTPRQFHAVVMVQKPNGHSSIFLFGGTDKAKRKYYDDLCELRQREVVVDNPCGSCSSTRRLLNNPKFSDVHFVVEGQIVYAHRAILYSRSEYFRTMFESQMRESSARVIPISDVTLSVFQTVMEYLYSKRANVTSGQHAVDVLKAADMFRLDGLRSLCVAKVEQAITVENVAAVCDIADTHNSESLKQCCMGFINQNFKSVINTDAFQNLMRDDPGGLGKEILESYADSYPYGPYSVVTHKRPRK